MTHFTEPDPKPLPEYSSDYSTSTSTAFSRPPKQRRVRYGWFLLAVAVMLIYIAGQFSAPYVIYQPGSVFNTLGEVETTEGTHPLISIDGASEYPTDGELNLLTIGQIGTPEQLPSWQDIVWAFFDKEKDVYPVSQVYPSGITTDEIIEQNMLQMENSQQEAVAAALIYLGYEFASTYTIHSFTEGALAEGKLLPGDEILSINGQTFQTHDHFRMALNEFGSADDVDVEVLREGKIQHVEVPLMEIDGQTVLGVFLQTNYDFPFDVTIQLDRVGGASAGMMFALGIIDKLTEDSLTGGNKISGTGTISASGIVGPIGGEKQKLWAAWHAGSEWFLIDRTDCQDLPTDIPDGLQVVPVGTLAEAVETVKSINEGLDPALFPTCAVG